MGKILEFKSEAQLYEAERQALLNWCAQESEDFKRQWEKHAKAVERAKRKGIPEPKWEGFKPFNSAQR